jgi:hypothetical protein
MADNPYSWAILTIIGLFFICKFLYKIIQENEKIKAKRMRQADEYFSESAIDKRNALIYNKFMKGGRKP